MEEARKEPLDLSEAADDIELQNLSDEFNSDEKENSGSSNVNMNCTELRTALHSSDNKRLTMIPENSESLWNTVKLEHKPVFDKHPDCTPKRTHKPVSEKVNTVCKSRHIASKAVPVSIPRNQLDGIRQNITVKQMSYVVWNEIARGGSSVVYHCFEPLSREQRAIKCVSLTNTASVVGYLNEVKLLEKLQNCENIIKMFD